MIYIEYTGLAEFNADFNNDFSIGEGVPNTLDIPRTFNTEE